MPSLNKLDKSVSIIVVVEYTHDLKTIRNSPRASKFSSLTRSYKVDLTYRNTCKEEFHVGSFPLDKVVDKLHVVLLALESGKVGQCLQDLGYQRQVSC